MFLEAALILNADMEQKIILEAKKLPEFQQRFVDAEQKENERLEELFKKLLEITDQESLRRLD